MAKFVVAKDLDSTVMISVVCSLKISYLTVGNREPESVDVRGQHIHRLAVELISVIASLV
jgi:hypothetical protein